MLWDCNSALGFFLRASLQAEDFLHFREILHELNYTPEEILDPLHFSAVVEGNDHSGASDWSLVDSAEKDSHDGEKCRNVEHAEFEPGKAAALDNACNDHLVKKAILFGCDFFLLLEGANDALSSHRFIEVAVHRGPNVWSDLIRLLLENYHGSANFYDCKVHEIEA